jgi:ribonuclease D
MIKQFKTNNPKRSDQKITQDVSVSDSLQYDYSKNDWIGIDTEFLSYNLLLDNLCVVQIASDDPLDSSKQRIEVIHTYNKKPDPKLVKLLGNDSISKIFHVFQADMPRIEIYTGERIKGEIFDTQIAARLAITNMESHSMENLIKYLVDPTFQQNKNVTSAEWDRSPEEWEESQFKYAAEDVMYLSTLKSRILDVAKRRGKLQLLNEIMTTLPAISHAVKLGYSPNLFGF